MIKENEIKAEESPKLFYLAGEKGWYEQCGHEIIVKGFRFSIIPQAMRINISEVTTGMIFYRTRIDQMHLDATETKQGMMDYIEAFIGPIIYTRMAQIKNFGSIIKNEQRKVERRIGKKPKTVTFESLEELKEYTGRGYKH